MVISLNKDSINSFVSFSNDFDTERDDFSRLVMLHGGSTSGKPVLIMCIVDLRAVSRCGESSAFRI